MGVLITLKEKMFDDEWLEGHLTRKLEEFSTSEKFVVRIQSLFMVKKVHSHVSEKFLNEKVCPVLIKLAADPVPNIRFNVAKTFELVYKRISNSNKLKCQQCLKDMENGADTDFDVKYYAQHALAEM